MNIANRFQKLFLLLLAFASIATFAPTAAAEKSYAPPEIEIENFSVTPEYLFPGAELEFTVEGTPRAKASVHISGINRTIPLKEVAEGVYEGSYIIKRTDRAVGSSTLRATLKSRGQSSSDTIRLPWHNAVATPPPAVTVVPAPVAHRHPRFVPVDVEYAVRHRLAEIRIGEIVRVHLDRLTLRTIPDKSHSSTPSRTSSRRSPASGSKPAGPPSFAPSSSNSCPSRRSVSTFTPLSAGPPRNSTPSPACSSFRRLSTGPIPARRDRSLSVSQ